MVDLEVLRDCYVSTFSRIVMLVADGLGGVPHPDTHKSELEAANLPNLSALAAESACGLTIPVLPGVAPGSGPGHLSLFGYDPLKYVIGRGVLEALGVGVQLREGEVAVRGNFCTIDDQGLVVDRRAGRIPTELTTPLCQRLGTIQLPGVELSVYPVKDHRFALVLRGDGLDDRLTETDPQKTGVAPPQVRPLVPEAERTAQAANRFVYEARRILQNEERANMVLLRGISSLPHLPQIPEVYKLKPAAIAAYPMYRGIAQVMGMDVVPTGPTFRDEVKTLEHNFERYDFFFIHYKPSDAAGEDGSFQAKVETLEEFDSYIPQVRKLDPDVLIVAGDHATPSLLAHHSWHPVPFLLHSRWTLGEGIDGFSERACARGSLGTFPAVHIMLLALSHAGKLAKFGA